MATSATHALRTVPRTPDVTGLRSLTAGHILLPLLILVTFISHAFHMFSYPLYLGDEGIYMEQAWTVLKNRGLTPYTYFYDHAPGGWLLIAAWLRLLPHGVYQWGMAINSGRVLMLLLAVASTVLLYRITRRFTGSAAAGLLAGTTFALSPLSLFYGRMVLLDNIMLFWVLVALELLTSDTGLYALFGGGAAFGVALLTKEDAAFFAPVMVYALYTASRTHPFFRFGVWGWIFVALSIVSFYPLFALLKGELFGTDAFLLNPNGGHVNLIGALQWQLFSRSVHNGSILNWNVSGGMENSFFGWQIHYVSGGFWDYYFNKWAAKDPVILLVGMAASCFNLLVALLRPDLRRPYLIAAALALIFSFYLIRGAVLLEFYILPLLPILALNIALAAHFLLRPLPRPIASPVLVVLAVALGIYFTKGEQIGTDAFTVTQTTLQAAQVAYVRAHIPTDAVIEIDDDLWVDLHDSGGGVYPVYPYADPHYKIAGDPAVRRKDGIVGSDWSRIQYVVASNQMLGVLRGDTTDYTHVALNAYLHSRQIWSDRVGQVLVEVRKVEP